MSLSYDKFVLFGDSITQFANYNDGFALQPALQDLYQRKLDIVNRGFSGYNSTHATLILPKLLEAELNQGRNNVKVITIFFGTNDATLVQDHLGTVQRVSVEQYSSNIEKLVLLSLEAGVKPIVISPALHDGKLGKQALTERSRPLDSDWSTSKHILQYVEAGAKVAQKHNVAFVNLWEAFREFGGWSKEQVLASTSEANYISYADLLPDGVHFSGKGYKILYEEIVKAIDTNWPELSEKNLPLNLLYWDQISVEDPASIFGKPRR